MRAERALGSSTEAATFGHQNEVAQLSNRRFLHNLFNQFYSIFNILIQLALSFREAYSSPVPCNVDLTPERILKAMTTSPLLIDGLQYCRWDRETLEDLRAGGVHAVHVTVSYWESTRETLTRLAEWDRRFEAFPELLSRVQRSQDVLDARSDGKVGVFFGFQHCSPIEEEIGLVELFRRLGVLFMQLTYNNQSVLASGCYEQHDGGVSRFGREVIREMNRVGMVVDMSHSGERSTLQAIELSARPIVVSHANPAAWHGALRNKSDPLLLALARSGGLLGLSLYAHHLAGGGECTLESFCDMVARTVDLMGIDHVGFGSDLCVNQPVEVVEWMRSGRWTKGIDLGEGSRSQPGWPEQPGWFKNSRDFPGLLQGLQRRGFKPEELQKIAGQNWLRILDQSATPG